MISASRDNSTALLEAMWMRYLPHINFLRKVLKENHIGEIHSLYACHGQNLTNIKNPRLWTKELGGGALLDLGIYVVSLSQMILGTPKNILAKSIFTKKGVDAKTASLGQSMEHNCDAEKLKIQRISKNNKPFWEAPWENSQNPQEYSESANLDYNRARTGDRNEAKT